MTNRDV
jgi:hypothetical protein